MIRYGITCIHRLPFEIPTVHAFACTAPRSWRTMWVMRWFTTKEQERKIQSWLLPSTLKIISCFLMWVPAMMQRKKVSASATSAKLAKCKTNTKTWSLNLAMMIWMPHWKSQNESVAGSTHWPKHSKRRNLVVFQQISSDFYGDCKMVTLT